MAAAINGKPPVAPSSSCFAYLPAPYLSSHTSPCTSLCLCNTPTHARDPNSTDAAASGSRRRRQFITAGEGLVPSPFLFDSWGRQELNEHVLSQVPVPDARGSRAPITPERRPIRRRCQASPPAPSLGF
jgi:hypothetical protein